MDKIDHFRRQIKEKLQANPIGVWREEIPEEVVAALIKQHAPASRQRLWSMETLLWLWLTYGICRERSFNALVADLWVPLCVEIPELSNHRPNRGRMAEGRARLPVSLLQEIRRRFAQTAVHESPAIGMWRGRRLLWIDGSTTLMPDEPELRNHFGSCTTQCGPGTFPLARIVNLGIAGTRIVLGSAYGPYRTAEVGLALSVVDQVQAGDVITADRLLACSPMIWMIQQRGGDVIMRKHAQLKVEKHPHQSIGPKDWIIELKIDSAVRKRYPQLELPKTMKIRVFQVEAGDGKNQEELWIETTLLDAQKYPKEELARLYWTRWGAEVSYAEIKLELHLDLLRSKTVEGIKREIEAHLAAYNYVRLQMIRAAKQAGVDPRQLSFVETIRTIVRFGQILRDCIHPRDRCEKVSLMITLIATAKLPPRPNRHEPRERKLNPKKFPRLKNPRKQWKMEHGYAA